MTYALAVEPDSLDPANALGLAAEAAGRPLYDGLLSFGPNFEPRPSLAERWVASDDGLLYTFFVRRDVRFHDGNSFNARAAQYNLDRLLGQERPARREVLTGLVRAARAVDEYQLEVSLWRPLSSELHRLAQFGAAMVSPEAHRSRGKDLGLSPVGSGPFRFVEWQRGQQLVLEPVDESWRGRPGLDRLVFKAVPDEAARLRLLEQGEVQLGSASLDMLPRLQAATDLAADVVPSAQALGIAMNTQVSPFNDRRVRQALNYAIDKEALASVLYQGQAVALGGPVAPSVRGAFPQIPYPFDPARARLLLAAAGFPNGFETQLLTSSGRFTKDAVLGQEVQQQLEAVGVRARLDVLNVSQFNFAVTKSLDETALRLSTVGWLPASGDVYDALYPLFHSSQWMPKGFNTSFFKSPALDRLFERAITAESAQRDQLIWQAQELLHDEAPWIFLLSPSMVVARSIRLHEPVVMASGLVSVSERTWLE